MVTFTEEIPNGELHFLCSECGGILTHFLLENISANIDLQLESTSENEVDTIDESSSFIKIL